MIETNTPTYARFSDFATEDKALTGDKKRLDDILNQEILITGFKSARSKYQETNYTTIQFVQDGETFVAFTGSQVVADQLDRYKDNLPFLAVIRKVNKYYTLT